MPLMNGEECLADIRNEQKTAKIPVVIYSTHFDLFKVKFLKDKGADRYLQKPKSFSVLKTCLERCIESFYGDPKKVNPDDEFIIQQKRH
jgi:CheY-like chemotaxis protein